jgi:methylenetetrahydrofolate dehydrogenase (NADP+)/methenyltetrahydrofolate cyclohydrolase
MIIDGSVLASEVLARVKARTAKLPRPPRILVIVANDTPATKSYLAIKKKRAADAGCVLEELRFAVNATTTEELRAAVLSADADAVVVQLPLASGIDAKDVCDVILVSKDADVLSIAARTAFETNAEGALLPPVVGAVREIFMQRGAGVRGKKAVVIGDGWLVGNPVTTWLRQQGADVEQITQEAGDLRSALIAADIVVSGAGSPHFIKPEMLKEGVVLIDAGTSESGGALAGDADPACAEVCSVFTPVPGGVGPLAVACLFENAVTLAERAINR